MFTALTEIRYASRNLTKRPGYAAIAAFTLALGIGSSVAIFTLLNAIVLRPLPYPQADRIVEILHHAPGLNLPDLRSSPGLIARYRQTAHSFTHIAGYNLRQLNLTGRGTAERVRAVAATPDLFDVLATRPAIGRAFADSDAAVNGPLVTILTDGVWRARFGADPAVIGRSVELDGRPAEIVGVMPRGFMFPDSDTQLFVPLRLDPDAGFGAFGMVALARLAPGATPEGAQRELGQLMSRIPEWFPDITKELLAGFGWSVAVEPLRDRVIESVARTLWIVFAIVGLIPLVAAANVANLFLARAESRHDELAVRSALGASRGRIAATFLAEGLVLGAIGGVVGLLLADAGTRLLVTYGPPRLPRLQEVRLDGLVFAFAAAVSVVTSLVLASAPALGLTRGSFTLHLQDGGRSSTAGRRRHRVRQLLIVTQVAVSLVLLVGAGLMFRSVVRLSSVDPGFRVDGLLTAGLSVPARTDRANALTRYHEILDELDRLPGVSASGAASALPVAPVSLSGSSVELRSRPRSDNELPLFAMYAGVTARYFETLGVPLLDGRLPSRTDEDQDRAVAWVNETFARRYLDGRATGEALKLHDTWLQIAGIVGDTPTFGLGDEVRPTVYLPLSNAAVTLDVMYAVLRTTGDPGSLAPALRTAVNRVSASVPLTVRTMSDVVSGSLAQTTFTVTLLAIAAGIGLVLGVVGLYGAVSYIALQRTAEIGVRLALGAKPASVCLMVVRQGATVAAAGIVVGLIAAWSSARFMASMLFEISAHDPATYAAVALLLMAVSVIATYVPARRAARIDPVQALRGDA